jgi:hypothetical protein
MANTAITPDIVARQFCVELIHALDRQRLADAEPAKTGAPSRKLVADIEVPNDDWDLIIKDFTAKHIAPVVERFAPQIPSGATFLKNPLPQGVFNARQFEANGVCVSVIPVYNGALDSQDIRLKVELA